MSKKVAIEGHGTLLISRSDYVAINGKNYLKTDNTRVVPIDVGETVKFYRIKSPMITSHKGYYYLKKIV